MIAVVDASVAIKWVIPEPLSDHADRLRERAERLVVPDLLLPEVTNVLWKKLRRRELTPREAKHALELLMESGLEVRPSGPLLDSALTLARRLDHPVYDCIYVTLARTERATLVTADERLLSRLAKVRARVAIAALATV